MKAVPNYCSPPVLWWATGELRSKIQPNLEELEVEKSWSCCSSPVLWWAPEELGPRIQPNLEELEVEETEL